jgi:hypothetical protein
VQLSTSGHEPFFSWLGHSPVGLLGVGLTGIGLGVGIGFGVSASKASDNADSVAAAVQSQIESDNRMGNKTPANVCNPSVGAQIYARYQKACGVLTDDFDKRDTDKNIATAGFVGAGIGLVTITVGYLVSGKASSSKAAAPSKNSAQAPRAVVVPVFATHESGLAIIGRF